MALPAYNTTEDKGQIQEIVKEIATAVFKSAKVSMESAAKAVIPSVPDMVDDVLNDLKSGSVRTFNLALDKLDKIVQQLGIKLKDYSKELADFQQNREEKLIKSEEKIQSLREKNIVAMIEKSGDIKILSKKEIELRQENLRTLEKDIQREEKQLEKERKLLQESNKLQTNTVKKTREDIENRTQYIKELQSKRQEEIEVLGEKSQEQPGFFQRAREGAGNLVEDYVPTPIAEVGQQFVEGLMAPINVIKDLAVTFGGLLKPLKLFKPLLTGLLGGLKKFMVGLMSSVIAFLPFIAIGALVVVAILGIITVLRKLKNYIADSWLGKLFGMQKDKEGNDTKMNKAEPGSAGDIQGETFLPDDNFTPQKQSMTTDMSKKNLFTSDDAYSSPNILPMNDTTNKLNISDFKKTMPVIKPDQLKPMTDMMAGGGTFTAVNSPQTVVNRTSNSLSSGISGVSNKDAWYNTAST
jgi:hypothetical protein